MQKRFLRKAAFTLIMLLILVSASSALAATASKTYTEAKITHVWKCGPISRSSGSTKMTTRVLYLRYLVWNDIRL